VVAPPSERSSKPSKGKTSEKAATREKAAESKKAPARATIIPVDIKVLNPKGNREVILLVDDETEIAELAAEMLTDEGYKVILARDGFEALKSYQQIPKQIRLVIIVLFLPVMVGVFVFVDFISYNMVV